MGLYIPSLVSWLAWNVRGLNKRYRQKELTRYLRENRVKLAGLIETRVKEHKTYRISNKISPGWGFEANYTHAMTGRIWLPWDNNVYWIKILKNEAQLIQCNVISRNQVIDCDMIMIYGHNSDLLTDML